MARLCGHIPPDFYHYYNTGAASVNSGRRRTARTAQKNNFDFLKKTVAFCKSICYNTYALRRWTISWGYSSAGRALEWHSRGQRFDPAYLHQKKHRFYLVSVLFSFFFRFSVLLGQRKSQQNQPFCPLCRRKAVKMAYIQEKLKGKKIASFKFKACVGRDGNGKHSIKVCANERRSAECAACGQ